MKGGATDKKDGARPPRGMCTWRKRTEIENVGSVSPPGIGYMPRLEEGARCVISGGESD